MAEEYAVVRKLQAMLAEDVQNPELLSQYSKAVLAWHKALKSGICERATEFIKNQFPSSMIEITQCDFGDSLKEKPVFSVWPIIATDFKLCIKRRVLAVESLGGNDEIELLAAHIVNMFELIPYSVYSSGKGKQNSRSELKSPDFPYTPHLIIYTNRTIVPVSKIIESFEASGLNVEVIEHKEMYKTVFISYGGPDSEKAKSINNHLKSNGIDTWFFPDDALPGQKLHRVMHEGVNQHDCVLLICSKDSLSRNGVLNELERVLEREAKEGGSEILIPVTIDDHVYAEWSSERPDIAEQIRARVITKLSFHSKDFDAQINKLLRVLKKP